MLKHRIAAIVPLLILTSSVLGEPLRRGYHPKVEVSGDTRLDWTFTLANQSLTTPPADWTPGYDSTAQSYELFVPQNYNPKRSYPLVLFISPGNQPGGWKAWQEVCQKEGVLFAGAYEAGNNCPMRKRLRIVMDVFDDVRRTYNTDPDRTYLSGFSGGARAACAIGFALPECIGGLVPICAGGDLRNETWLQHRAQDRLSIALVTGEKDFNRGEVERYKGPMWKELGIRSKVWVPDMGHSLPQGKTLNEVYAWLEEGAKDRADFARIDPTSRYPSDKAVSRENWSAAILSQGKKRMGDRKTFYSGLMLIQGAMARWPDLPAATEAEAILLKVQDGPSREWEKEDIAGQRRQLIARARALDSYASGPLPKQYDRMRSGMINEAIKLWQTVIKDGQDLSAVEQAKRRLPALEQLAKGE